MKAMMQLILLNAIFFTRLLSKCWIKYFNKTQKRDILFII